MIIEKINNTIVFNKDGIQHVYPLNSIMMIANDDSNVINVRLRASRKNVLTFNWNEVTNIQASSATNMMEQISLLSNAGKSSGCIYIVPEDGISFNNTESIDLTEIDTSNVTNMSYMFQGCSGLTSIDLTPLNTENVTNMSYMFQVCSSLTSLDVSPLNTKNVTNMSNMFGSCYGLTSLDLLTLNTDNVTNMNHMFNGCNGLTSLDLSNFNTSNVTKMEYMFEGCSNLTSLVLSNFETSNVTSMYFMFGKCSALTTLDLSNFNTSACTSMTWIFSGCTALETLDVTGWEVLHLQSGFPTMQMLSGCTALNKLILGEVTQEEYDWWYAKLTEAGIQSNVTIEYTII